MTSSCNNRSRPFSIIAGLLILTGLACAQQDDPAAAQVREEIGAQIKELSTTLRAAAMSGVISGREARMIYDRVVEAAKASYVHGFGDPSAKENDDAGADPKTNVARLFAPQPERVRLLLQPEFLRRDLPRLERTLDLDRSQMTIVQTLFEDYSKAFELAAAPLREALEQYRGSTINAYIAFALQDAGVRLDAAADNARRADRDEAMARMRATLSRIDEEKRALSGGDRSEYKAWKESVLAATSELDDRLAAIRERTTRQLNDMARDDARITADDVLRMARQLQADRAQLCIDLTRSIEAIATEEQRGVENTRLDTVLARMRIGMLLPHGRLGGESMNLWAALTEVSRDLDEPRGERGPLAYAEQSLDVRAPGIAARFDTRTEATIDREIAGIEYRALRDRIAAANGESIFEVDRRRLIAAAGPYVAALRREVTASVAVRDELLLVLNELVAALNEVYPASDVGSRLRDASLRRGFPVEMRPRWSEQAITSALELEDLQHDVFEALLLLDVEIASGLARLRATAIDKRVSRDPKLAREFIKGEFEDADIEFDDDVWRELEFEGFTAIDDRTESQLRSLLTSDQFESLPSRPRGWDAWKKELGESKGQSGNGKSKRRGGEKTSGGR
jgi:hypothetical protein